MSLGLQTRKQEAWKDLKPLLFAPALFISAYLSYLPGFGFWFMGAKNLKDFGAFGVPALALFIVILGIWWSVGSALLLVAGTLLFFYVNVHDGGISYRHLREWGMNPGLLISVTLLVVTIAVGDILAGQGVPKWHFQGKTMLPNPRQWKSCDRTSASVISTLSAA